jgi:hypothetical protein
MSADLSLAAGQLVQLGYAPRPVLPSEKRPSPALGDWRQPRSLHQILDDFAGQPADARIGILTDQLLVVDFDKKAAVDGEDEYRGPLAEGWAERILRAAGASVQRSRHQRVEWERRARPQEKEAA